MPVQVVSGWALDPERIGDGGLEIVTTALQRAGAGAVVVGADLRFVFVNDVAAEINGHAPVDHIGAHLDDILVDTAAAAADLIHEVLRTGEPVLGQEITGVTDARPGELRTWEGDYLPVRTDGDPNGPIDAVLIVFVEVTEERRAERRLRQVIDGLFTFVGLCDVDGTLLEANEYAISAAGIEPSDVIGRPFWDCYWWSYDPTVQDQLREAVADAAAGRRRRYDVYVRVAGGRLIPIDFQLVPVVERGEVVSLVPSGIDIEGRTKQMTALAELAALAADVHGALGIQELVELIVNRSSGIFGTTLVMLGVVDSSDGSIRVTTPVGLDRVVAERWTHLPLDGPRSSFHDAIETGSPVWLSDPEQRRAQYPEMAHSVERAGLAATAALPLIDSSGVIGVLGLGWPEAVTDEPTLRLQAALFADICGQALQRVIRTRSTVELVRLLTDQLLSRRDNAEQLDVAVGYVPAVNDIGFGGDWYDVVSLSDAATALIVGDVVGHDVEAAARMAVTRSALRTAVLARPGLLGVSDLVTHALGLSEPEYFATALVATIDTERRELRCKSFGHPPAIVIEPDGSATVLSATGPPIGMLVDPAPIHTHPLVSGSCLVLYTDGLVESRTESLEERMALVSSTVASVVGSSASEILETLMSTMIVGDNEDDVAVIVATIP